MSENFAIGKATSILEAILKTPHPANVADLADQLGMSRQTIHRILAQLCEVDLIARDATRQRFFVGGRLRALAIATLLHSHVDSAANLILRDLVNVVRETSNLGMLDGDQVVYLNRVECDWPLRVQLRPGSRVPVYCTAIGKLLLANLPVAAQQALIAGTRLDRLTPYTKTARPEILSELRRIAKLGYATNNQEDTLGLVAVAVPVRDSGGRVVAGLSVHALEVRMPIKELLAHLPLMRRTAARLSRVLFNPGSG